jgi:hypothetical protein
MVPHNPSPPTVNLTNMQREQIPKTVLTEHILPQLRKVRALA